MQRQKIKFLKMMNCNVGDLLDGELVQYFGNEKHLAEFITGNFHLSKETREFLCRRGEKLMQADLDSDASFALALSLQEEADMSQSSLVFQTGLVSQTGLASQIDPRVAVLLGESNPDDNEKLIKALREQDMEDHDAELARKMAGIDLESLGLVKALEVQDKMDSSMDWPSVPIKQDEFYRYKCPHCGVNSTVKEDEIACTIFTCCVTSAGQINQHLPHDQVVAAMNAATAAGQSVYGCGLQYRFVKLGENNYTVEKCQGQ